MTVKKALHLSAVPSSVLCRDVEQKKVVGFCKASVVGQIPGSLYVCGCPGTGKSLTMEQIKSLCVSWASEVMWYYLLCYDCLGCLIFDRHVKLLHYFDTETLPSDGAISLCCLESLTY